MSRPFLPAWAVWIVRAVVCGVGHVRTLLGWYDERSAHHGESVAYYQQRNREGAHG